LSFISAHAPQWVGKWESAFRSVKLHLRRVIGYSILTHPSGSDIKLSVQLKLKLLKLKKNRIESAINDFSKLIKEFIFDVITSFGNGT